MDLRRLMLAGGCVASTGLCASAAVFPVDFEGTAGSGLLPGNEPGSVVSTAVGDEVGSGLEYDDATNFLSFDFAFDALTGGLADVAGGIHIHLATPGDNPLSETGGIEFSLNTGTDPAVILTSPLVAIGATDGQVTGTITLTESQEEDLFASRYYLNIHSEQFTSGELRGNLVVVPEPVSAAGFGLLGLGGLMRRRS